MQAIPVVSLQRAPDAEQSAALAAACEDHGFFLVRDHGHEALVQEVFAQSAAFFAQPRAQKLEILRDAENPLGYYDRELTKLKRDQKEVFDFKAGGYISRNPARQTRWPSGNEPFRSTMSEFFGAFTTLSEQVMELVLAALGLPREAIAKTMQAGFGAQHTSAARLNYYPPSDPLPEAEREGVNALGDMALHHHTDPGAITLLLQDAQGGLQARSKVHGWIDVEPQPDTIVVNVGDVLQVWTNDRCTAGEHRVLPVGGEQGRFSTPFFYQPRHDAVITPWVRPGETPRYRSFSWREFIRGRVTDNFADYGAHDIQVERYRVA